MLNKKKKLLALNIALAMGVSFACGSVSAETPSFFDWRLNNPTDSNSGADSLSIVSPVESQFYGTCWTFGTFSSYESSWMKQLKAAQAAGYNVTPSRNLFSKYYLAWTAFMPPLDNVNNTTPHALIRYNNELTPHPIYQQGGNLEKPTSTLLNYGAVDASEFTITGDKGPETNAATLLNTEAALNRLYNDNMPRNYLILQKYNDLVKDLSAEEKKTKAEEYANKAEAYVNSLTEEEIKEKILDAVANNAVLKTAQPKGILHDTYIVKNMIQGIGLTEEEIADTKELIQTEGAVFVAHAADGAFYATTGEVDPFQDSPNHAESLVGWDDNYTFKNHQNADGTPVKGAFIIRNSWGTTVAEATHGKKNSDQSMALDGYGYLAYQDATTTGIGFFNAGLDAKRYTINQNNAPALDSVDFIGIDSNPGTQAIANSFTAGTNSGQFLKAVMFYASEKNMPYEIIVREGETPGVGAILTQQTGTFGEDGTPKWGGYRTVDLNNYVFLAKDKKYTVEVRTTSPTGSTVYIGLMAGQDVKMDGESYFYYDAEKAWIKTDKMRYYNNEASNSTSSANLKADGEDLTTGYDSTVLDPSEYQQIYIFTAARNKESAEANGGDFTVSYLDDSNTDSASVVNLGSATELYGSDYTNPDRKTLSNMTVDLSADSYNTFKGSIIGEGSVTKTGEGFLALNGKNTYTGGTLVNNGRLDVNGSIEGDATVTDKGVISGSGKIGGALKNNATAVAGNAIGEGDLTVNSLESSGKLITQGDNKFVVKTTANVEGSTVSSIIAKPDEDITVVEAAKVTGTVKNNSAENAEKVSAMLDSYAQVTDNKVILKTDITNNMGELSGSENEGFNAVKNMSVSLKGDSRKDELMPLLYSDATSAKSALSAMVGNTASEMFAATERSSVVNDSIRERALNAFNADNTKVHHNGWVKYTKNWGDLKSGANYHSQGIIGGYDEAMGKNWRGGVFVGYNATGLGAKNANGNMYDTRFGVYALYNKGVNDAYIYADYGEVKNRLNRGIPTIGVSTEAKYDSSVVEIGGEFKRNLQPSKMWNVSPFVNLQFTYLKQDSYNEKNGGIFNHHVKMKKNNYLAGTLGVEFKRNFKRGGYLARVGVKHAFTKLDGALDYAFEGDANNLYTMRANQSRTHLVLSVGGENEFANGFILGGNLELEKGSGDKNISASLLLKKVW